MSDWGKTILGAAGLVAAAVAVGLLNNHISDEAIGLNQHPLEAVSDLDSSRFLTTLEAARAKWEAGVVFVDARAEDFYLYEGHIPGAISLPIVDFDRAFPGVVDQLPGLEEEIVCYCSGYGCEESTELARELTERGYQRVYVYTGGWPEWSESGLPVETAQVEDP